MKPIRVLQVFARLDRGGAEAMLMDLYRKINREEIQFDFIVNARSKPYIYEAEINKLGGRIFHIPQFKIYNFRDYQKSWKKILADHPEWSIIHAHHTSPAFIYLSVAKKLGRHTIAHSHIANCEKSFKSYLKIAMRYPLRHIANDLFSCSIAAGRWMFGRKGKFAVVNNAIDCKPFAFNNTIREIKREQLGLGGKFVMGHVGRFVLQKNHSLLVDIFADVAKQDTQAVLLLIGDGDLRQTIEKKVAKLGLADRVLFTGVRTDVPQLMQAMDVFVFPSFFEGLPVTLIEAQAAGLPCVMSDAITDEVAITNLVEPLSLNTPVNTWAKEVLSKRKNQRRDMRQAIKKAGYDVEKTAAWLGEFYLEAVPQRAID